jgi:ribonuclease HI
MTYNPHAIYVTCDAGMDYDSKLSGGVGFVITFPDSVNLDSIKVSIGRYEEASIERLELEAIIQGMEELIRLNKTYGDRLRNVNQIIIVTDRFALREQERTSAYRIRDLRKNKWKNSEGKPVKNHDLLEKLDKTRKKVVESLHCKLNIEYQPSKKTKAAHNLAKEGKQYPLKNDTIAIKGTKTSKRYFDGSFVDYKQIKANEIYPIHVYRKEPVQNEWEIFGEILEGRFIGRKINIYTDNLFESKIHRQHIYRFRIKSAHKFHIRIYKTFTEVKDKSTIIKKANE